MSIESKEMAMIKTILFDLDGTLLPMDQNAFTKAYFKSLAEYLLPFGYEPKELIDEICQGTNSMVNNRGGKTNESVFWEVFAKKYVNAEQDKPLFDKYYLTKFNELKKVCGFDNRVSKLIKLLKAKGFRLVLASNPVFPKEAQKSRMRWAGVEVEDFDYITYYENSSYCKPNPAYYTTIAQTLGVTPEECLMVGNDVDEDMVAESTGMKVFLLTNCLINRSRKNISVYPKGNFEQLLSYLEEFEMRRN